MNNTQSVSYFHEDFKIPWEQAFNKRGYCDGTYSLTYAVSDALDEYGLVALETLSMSHNDTITSIKREGVELMPD